MTPEALSNLGPCTASNVDTGSPIEEIVRRLWAFDTRMNHAARSVKLDIRRFGTQVPRITPKKASSP